MRPEQNLPRVARAVPATDRTPALPTAPDVAPINVPSADPVQPATDWAASHGGTPADYAVYSYLVSRFQLLETRDFIYTPAELSSSGLGQFNVGPLVIRVLEEQVLPAPVDLKLNRLKLQGAGYTVVDVQAQDLSYRLEQVMGAAMRGIQL